MELKAILSVRGVHVSVFLNLIVGTQCILNKIPYKFSVPLNHLSFIAHHYRYTNLLIVLKTLILHHLIFLCRFIILLINIQ